MAHNLWLSSGKSSPVNTVEVKRKNRVEIKIGNKTRKTVQIKTGNYQQGIETGNTIEITH